MEYLKISTVTPVFRGEKFIRDLVIELACVRDELQSEEFPARLVEAIFVLDGGIDNSIYILEELQTKYEWVKIVSLSRNFGQHPATVAGILHSNGDWVATLDEDLQHSPEHIKNMLIEAIVNEQDLVYGVAEKGSHKSLFRDLSSKSIKWIVARITKSAHVKYFSSFRLVRGSIARAAASVSMPHTYLDIALCWFTSRVDKLVLPLVDVRVQFKEQSSYRFAALLNHAKRLLLSSDIKVVKGGVIVGIGSLAFSIFISLYILSRKYFYPETINVQGWTSLLLAIMFYGGVLCLLLAISLEYMATVLQHVLGQPSFFIVDRSKDQLLVEYLARREQS